MTSRRAGFPALLAAVLAIAAGALVPHVTTEGAQHSALIAAIAAVLAFPLLARGIRREFDPFEPLVFFAAVWGMMFVARPLVMQSTGDTWLRGRYDIADGVSPALALGLVGAVSFVLAYQWGVKRRLRTQTHVVRREPPRPWTIVVPAVLGFGAVAALGGRTLTNASSGGSGAYLYLAPLLTIPTIVLVLRRGHRVMAYLLLVVSIAGLLTLGQRAFVIWPVSAVFIYECMARRSRPNLMVIAAIVVFGFLPLSTLLETARERQVTPLAALTEAAAPDASAAFQRFTEGDTTAMFSALALQMMTEGSTWHQRPGYWFISTPTRWIPSALWANKPLGSGEYLYTLYFPEHYRYNKASTAFTLASEFYFDLGILGVVLGMGGIGWLCGRLWIWVCRRKDEPWAWALYAPVFGLAIVVFRGDVGLAMGLALFVLVPLLIAYAAAPIATHAKQKRPTDARA